jgi:translation initiation factor IF-2
VVFLDTPGHEAFTKMRARGANITDVAVLVVAADDGVMPQTEEAISHARAAGVPIVVAVNKIDKPQANPERVKRQLADLGLIWDQWGGNTVFCDVSAISKKGLDGLLEMLSLESDLLDLKTNMTRPAMGAVLEGRMTEDRGAVARILVQNGTLKRGEVILAGRVFGKVRALVDEHGHSVLEAGPSTPVEVVGLPEAPEAGDRFYAVSDLNKAKSIAEERGRRARETALRERAHITLENLFSRIAEGKAKEVRVILKADVKGSAEVLIKALQDLSTGEIKVRVLHQGIGGVTESDVLLADASDAMIIAFNVVPDDRARELARDKGVDVRVYQVIYHLMEELKAAMEGMLEPEEKEVVTAHLEIRQVFNISRVGTIAGCFVKSGTIARPDNIRLVRNGAIVYTGKMESLKRFKEDVREVKEGFECGVKIAGYDDLKNGDVIESFRIEKIARKLG